MGNLWSSDIYGVNINHKRHQLSVQRHGKEYLSKVLCEELDIEDTLNWFKQEEDELSDIAPLHICTNLYLWNSDSCNYNCKKPLQISQVIPIWLPIAQCNVRQASQAVEETEWFKHHSVDWMKDQTPQILNISAATELSLSDNSSLVEDGLILENYTQPGMTYYVHLERPCKTSYSYEEVKDELNKHDPVVKKTVHFSILTARTLLYTWSNQSSLTRSILKAYDEPRRYDEWTENEVLHQSHVMASHLYWSVKYERLDEDKIEDEDTRAEIGKIKRVFLSQDIDIFNALSNLVVIVRSHELHPIKYAANQDMLRQGASSMGRLSKIPTLVFPKKPVEKETEFNDPGSVLNKITIHEIEDINPNLEQPGEMQRLQPNMDVESSHQQHEPPDHHNFTTHKLLTLMHIGSTCQKSTQTKAVKQLVAMEMDVKGIQPSEIKEYVQQVLGKRALVPPVSNVITKNAKTSCNMLFPSKTSARKFIAAMSPIQSKTKCKVKMATRENPNATSRILQEKLADILEESKLPLSQHKEKMKEIADKLAPKTSKTKAKLNDLAHLLAEKDALKQKERELKKQEEEFHAFIATFKSVFERINIEDNYMNHVNKMKLRFDVEIARLAGGLPMYSKRQEIISMVAKNQVSILLGETGSGKSTQVTQYLYEAGFASNGLIVCTQPRKIAATSLAERVATEMKSKLGDLVGFKVGMNKRLTDGTSIVYMTDHMLLKECLNDRLLNPYACVIIDEAHERSLYTDLLLGMLKKALPKRPELRVIITSATIEPEIFVRYFSGCPVLKVSGRVFPVEVVYRQSPFNLDDNYEILAVEKAIEVAESEEPGDVLVFLTTPVETERASEKMTRLWKRGKRNLLCLALHGKMQENDRHKVFETTPEGKRKIIFATNIAETSITIPGIKYVIDTGFANEMMYDSVRNTSILKIACISKSSANQRKGRAGRTDIGKCYRLYSEDDFLKMEESSKPEILRVNLGTAILTLMSFSDEDPLNFDFVEMPPRAALESALETLVYLGAVKDGKLTTLGKKVSCMNIEPRLGKLVLNGVERGIGYEAVLVGSFSTMGGNMFFQGNDKLQSTKLKMRFCNIRGDIHTMLDVYKEWDSQPEYLRNAWCMENSINAKAMRMARSAAKEIIDTLHHQLHIKVNYRYSTSQCQVEDTLEGLILESYALNLCVFAGHEQLGYFVVKFPDTFWHIHPSSALTLLGKNPSILVYENTLTTSRDFLINVTNISPENIRTFCEKMNYPLSLDEATQKVVLPCQIANIGRSMALKFIGSKHETRLNIEKDLQTIFKTSMIVLEVNVDRGKLTVFTGPEHQSESYNLLRHLIEQEQMQLLLEDVERPIVEEFSVRAVLGDGGSIKTLLLSGEYRTIRLSSIPAEFELEGIVEMFREFGIVTDYTNFTSKTGTQCLKIVFAHPEAAVDMLNALNTGYISGVTGQPDLIGASGIAPLGKQEVKIRLTWCRRPNKSFGFIKFPSQPHHARSYAQAVASHVSTILTGGKMCRVSVSKKNDEELYVENLPGTVSCSQLRREIAEEILRRTNIKPQQIVIPSETAKHTTQVELEAFKCQIESAIKKVVPASRFDCVSVHIMEPQQHSNDNVAIVTLSDPTHASDVLSVLSKLNIKKCIVSTSMNIKTSVFIRKEVYPYVRHLVDYQSARLRESFKVDVTCKKLKSNNWVIDIIASSFESATKARLAILKCLEGGRIEIEEQKQLVYFLNGRGQLFLKNTPQNHNVLAQLDRYKSCIILYGKDHDVCKVYDRIISQMDEVMHLDMKVYHLKELYQPGMMKLLMAEYGLDLERLPNETYVDHIEVSLKKHTVVVSGTKESIANTDKVLDIQSKKIGQRKQINQEMPHCPICCDVISEEELFRLEYCGHAYCKPCITELVHHSVKDKKIPITCANEKCGKAIVIKDILTILGRDMSKLEPLMEASIENYVMRNHSIVRFCITPDCKMVYRVGKDGDKVFCEMCSVSICPSCHCQYHENISCQVYREVGGQLSGERFDEYSRETWLREDTQNRCLCPTCSNGIEKNGGCLHMTCLKCKAHICWKCKEVFATSRETYHHLGSCNV